MIRLLVNKWVELRGGAASWRFRAAAVFLDTVPRPPV
jgi:hypothetical protein